MNGEITYQSKSPTEGKYPAGSFVTISCNRGYIVTGSNHMMCGEDGNWGTPAPTCTGSNIKETGFKAPLKFYRGHVVKDNSIVCLR